MRRAVISIRGAWAFIQGGESVMERALALDDPKRFFNTAYRERRWDGKVRLNIGRKFPAGLTDYVSAELAKAGYTVSVLAEARSAPLDLSRFDRKYLSGITLWDHQYEAVLAMLTHERGVVKSATGSGKTAIAAAVSRYLWEECGLKSLVITSRRGLARQTARVFRQYYGDDIEVGQFGDGEKTTGIVTVATAQSLAAYWPKRIYSARNRRHSLRPCDPKVRRLVQEAGVLIYDECHHAGSSTSWFDVGMVCPAVRRYGMSGTPIKDDEVADLRLIGATGPVIYDASASDMISVGLARRPRIVVVASPNASGPSLPSVERVQGEDGDSVSVPMSYATAYRLGVVESEHHNRTVTAAVRWLVERDRRVLVPCRRMDHLERLHRAFSDAGIAHAKLSGRTDTRLRDMAKAAFADQTFNVILATVIFDEGEDVPAIDAIVLAEGVKSVVPTIQRIGRGMRVQQNGPTDLWVVDIAPTSSPMLWSHAVQRVEAYEREGYDVTLLSDWPASVNQADPPDNLLPFEELVRAD